MNDTLLKQSGYQLLIDNLGYVEAERFISLIAKDSEDYTEWRKKYYAGRTVQDIYSKGSAPA
jgi:hypothetical protein